MLAHPRRALLIAAVLTLASMVAALWGSRGILNVNGWHELGYFCVQLGSLRLDGAFLAQLGSAAGTTVAIAVAAMGLVGVICVPGGLLASHRGWRAMLPGSPRLARCGYVVWRAFLVVPRTIHELVWALLLVMIIGLDPATAILAIAIPFAAMSAKVIGELLDEADAPAAAQLQARGVPGPVAFLYAVVPAVLNDILSYGWYRAECAIRSATVLGIVGMGGLGQEITVSLQGRQYGEVWTVLIALVLLSAGVESCSSWLRRSIKRQAAGRVLPATVVGLLFLSVLGWLYLDPQWARLAPERIWDRTLTWWRDAWPPDFSAHGLIDWVDSSVVTLAMSWLGMVLAVVMALALVLPQATALLADRRASTGARIRHGITRLILIVVRAVPPPLWALLIAFVLFPGVVAGAVALGIYTAGILGRLFVEVLENADRAPLRTLTQTGAGPVEVMCYGFLPAHSGRLTSLLVYRGEETLRTSIAVGVVAAGGLGQLLQEYRTSLDFSGVLATLLVYMLLIAVVDVLGHRLRRR